ncbi:MAG: right-handed parallel beta-helix repeat-containing protein [Planctomycetota bacterium]|nr:right-handed parallel beta-helix repeat-containing protein [Planctomycetota bacterium]
MNAYDDLSVALEDARSTIINGGAFNVQVWVAEGTYKPTAFPQSLPADDGQTNSYAFEVHTRVELYGGFLGTEDSATNPKTGRLGNFEATVLTGEIGDPRDPLDNCYSVIRVGALAVPISSPRIDGFKIEQGEALQPAGTPGSRGGGLRVWNTSDLVVANCTFTDNRARAGAGVFLSRGSFQMKYCTFLDNRARIEGGGMHIVNLDAASHVHNCVFELNQAGIPQGGEDQTTMLQWKGGGIYGEFLDERLTVANSLFFKNAAGQGAGAYLGENGTGQDPGSTFVNCTLTNNKAYFICTNDGMGNWVCSWEGEGAAFYYKVGGSTHTIDNSIVWDPVLSPNTDEAIMIAPSATNPTVSYSDVETGMAVWPGTGNLNTDPGFESPAVDNFELRPGSACREAGSNALLPPDAADLDDDDDVTEDVPFELQKGDARVFDLPVPIVEMGAHEFVPSIGT